jgi:hypothetical protein
LNAGLGVLSAAFGLFFLAALLAKLDGWHQWRAAVAELASSGPLTRAGSFGIPAAEAIVVTSLFAWPQFGLALASATLLALGVGVLALRRRHEGAKCGCFGDRSRSTIGWGLALRNLALSAVALLGALAARNYGADAISAPAAVVALLLGFSAVLVLEYRQLTSSTVPAMEEGSG